MEELPDAEAPFDEAEFREQIVEFIENADAGKKVSWFNTTENALTYAKELCAADPMLDLLFEKRNRAITIVKLNEEMLADMKGE